MSRASLDQDALLDWLQASCAAQGVPLVLRDAAVVAQVATLLGRPPAGARRARSIAPERLDPVEVEAGSLLAGSNDRVVEHGPDDCLPAVDAQVGPLAA